MASRTILNFGHLGECLSELKIFKTFEGDENSSWEILRFKSDCEIPAKSQLKSYSFHLSLERLKRSFLKEKFSFSFFSILLLFSIWTCFLPWLYPYLWPNSQKQQSSSTMPTTDRPEDVRLHRRLHRSIRFRDSASQLTGRPHSKRWTEPTELV